MQQKNNIIVIGYGHEGEAVIVCYPEHTQQVCFVRSEKNWFFIAFGYY